VSNKVEAIQTWPELTSTTEVRSFHGFTSFYMRFINAFNCIVAPITECLKKGAFEWTKAGQKASREVKQKLCQASILALPNFDDLFEIECDASGVGIGPVLVQSKRPIAYFSEKINGSKYNYSTYDKVFYAIVSALTHWGHYLKLKPFVLHFDH